MLSFKSLLYLNDWYSKLRDEFSLYVHVVVAEVL